MKIVLHTLLHLLQLTMLKHCKLINFCERGRFALRGNLWCFKSKMQFTCHENCCKNSYILGLSIWENPAYLWLASCRFYCFSFDHSTFLLCAPANVYEHAVLNSWYYPLKERARCPNVAYFIDFKLKCHDLLLCPGVKWNIEIIQICNKLHKLKITITLSTMADQLQK